MRTSGILDTRDLQERLEELEDFQTTLNDAKEELSEFEKENPEFENDEELNKEHEELADKVSNAETDFGPEEEKELKELEELSNEIPEWRDGNTLIPEDEWVDYCRELVNDLGYMPKELPSFIENNINWKGVSEDLAADYSQAEYQGTTYYYRNC